MPLVGDQNRARKALFREQSRIRECVMREALLRDSAMQVSRV